MAHLPIGVLAFTGLEEALPSFGVSCLTFAVTPKARDPENNNNSALLVIPHENK